MGRPRVVFRKMPHTEGYGDKPNRKDTPGETTLEIVWFGEETPVKNK